MRAILILIFFSLLSLSTFAAEIRLKGHVPVGVSYQTFSLDGLTVLKNSSDDPIQVILYTKSSGRLPASENVKTIQLGNRNRDIILAHQNYRKIVIIAP